jgi:hypothetical protein
LEPLVQRVLHHLKSAIAHLLSGKLGSAVNSAGQ